MEGKFEVGRLTADMLRYELRVRGVTPATNCDEMRQTLRKLIKLERNKSFRLPKNPIAYDEDEEAVRTGIEKYHGQIEALGAIVSGSAEFKKIATRLQHLIGRANRANATEDEERETISKYVGEIVSLMTRLEMKTRVTSTPQRGTAAVESMESSTGIGDFSGESAVTSGDDDVVTDKRAMPVMKWGVDFSGDGRRSLSAFLERVNELRVARGVSKAVLFTSAVDLFTGSALVWYRANRDQYTTWEEIVEGLKFEFQPVDYDERLIEEIKRRTQGPSESIGMYVAVMKNLFSRLGTNITKLAQVKIIVKNLTPSFQRQLALVEIKSVDQLLQLGRKLEATRTAVNDYVPPTRMNKTLEPDLAYVSVDVDVAAAPVLTESVTRTTGLKSGACWNCGVIGHRAQTCHANYCCFIRHHQA